MLTLRVESLDEVILAYKTASQEIGLVLVVPQRAEVVGDALHIAFACVAGFNNVLKLTSQSVSRLDMLLLDFTNLSNGSHSRLRERLAGSFNLFRRRSSGGCGCRRRFIHFNAKLAEASLGADRAWLGVLAELGKLRHVSYLGVDLLGAHEAEVLVAKVIRALEEVVLAAKSGAHVALDILVRVRLSLSSTVGAQPRVEATLVCTCLVFSLVLRQTLVVALLSVLACFAEAIFGRGGGRGLAG